MKQVLLVIGGIVQTALAALHVGMFFAPIPAPARPTAYVLNACVTAAALFFAYVSLFRRRELIETAIGRVICWSTALFYLHAVVSGVARSGRLFDDPFKFGFLLPLALLYAFVAAPAPPRQALLAIGGLTQLLLAALHVLMFFGPEATPFPGGRPSFIRFNGAVAVAIAFLAYVSLFRRKDLIEAPLGRVVCGFTALFYLQRAALGIVVPGFDEPGLVWALLAIALVYGFVAVPATAQS